MGCDFSLGIEDAYYCMADAVVMVWMEYNSSQMIFDLTITAPARRNVPQEKSRSFFNTIHSPCKNYTFKSFRPVKSIRIIVFFVCVYHRN
jgi:hypothetical protein